MSGELHEVSEAIGELRTEVRIANEQRRETNRRLSDVAKQLEGLVSLTQRVNRIEPLVNEHEAAAQRSRGIHTAISTTGGVVGGVAGSGVIGYVARKLGWW